MRVNALSQTPARSTEQPPDSRPDECNIAKSPSRGSLLPELPQRDVPPFATGSFAVLPTEIIQYVASRLDPMSVISMGSTCSDILRRIRPQVNEAAAVTRAEVDEAIHKIETDTPLATSYNDFAALIYRIEKLPRSRRPPLLIAIFQKYRNTYFDRVERAQAGRLFESYIRLSKALSSDQRRDMNLTLAQNELLNDPQVNVRALAQRFELDDEKSIEALELESRTLQEDGETLESAAERSGIRSRRGIEALKIRSAVWSACHSDFRIDLAAERFDIAEPETRAALEKTFAFAAAQRCGRGMPCAVVARLTGICTPLGLVALRLYLRGAPVTILG